MNEPINAIGHRYGKLLVVEPVAHINGRRAYKCICDCGNAKIARLETLRSGFTKSCGCVRAEMIANLNKSHSMSKSPEYKSWSHAKTRCTNKQSKKYPYYGARGITMCQEWIDSFEAFFAYVGPKPSSQHSIGRIDVNKGYEPGNVRWETLSDQARSRTDNVFVFLDGKKIILKDACKKLNLNYKKVSKALKHKGKTWEGVLNEREFFVLP
jgi:hypothetical protein